MFVDICEYFCNNTPFLYMYLLFRYLAESSFVYDRAHLYKVASLHMAFKGLSHWVRLHAERLLHIFPKCSPNGDRQFTDSERLGQISHKS